jgi:hypothetical protein
MQHKLTGTCLFLGGVTFLVANLILFPMIPQTEDWTDSFASTAFLARLSVAAASVFFLLVGSFGIMSRQAHKVGWFGKTAFAIVFIGSVTTFAHEWAQVFFLHPLAVAAPEGLRAIGDAEFPSLYLVEAILVLSLFMVGWMLLMASTLMARVFSPLGPVLVLGGMLAMPALAPALPGIWGFIVGNGVIGLGWTLMGLELRNAAPASDNLAAPA